MCEENTCPCCNREYDPIEPTSYALNSRPTNSQPLVDVFLSGKKIDFSSISVSAIHDVQNVHWESTLGEVIGAGSITYEISIDVPAGEKYNKKFLTIRLDQTGVSSLYKKLKKIECSKDMIHVRAYKLIETHK